MTYSALILRYLAENPDIWFREGKFHGLETSYGFIGYRGDREVRDLIKKGLVEAKMEGRFREIRHKQETRVVLPPARELHTIQQRIL